MRKLIATRFEHPLVNGLYMAGCSVIGWAGGYSLVTKLQGQPFDPAILWIAPIMGLVVTVVVYFQTKRNIARGITTGRKLRLF